MTDRSNEAIKDLVISYSAYMSAIKERKDYAIVTWARCLLDDQERTGVEMIGTQRLRESIKHWEPELEGHY
jgi:hypothetical protein